MKRLICLLSIAALNNSIFAVQINGITTKVEQPSPGFFQYVDMTWVSDSTSYTNGGITITWPTDVQAPFTIAPYVIVSVQPATYATNTAYEAMVTANSSTSATIRVNKVVGTTVSEASTNDVTVIVYAHGT